jgi:hypothetical protein
MARRVGERESSRSADMQKWTYRYVVVDPSSDTVRRENGAEATLENGQLTPPVSEYLAERGEQGWELVTAYLTVANRIMMVLKQPKP